MKSSLSKVFIFYGVFLIVAGLAGYLSNPAKAATALVSGGTFGAISILLGLTVDRHKLGRISQGVGVVVLGLLSIVFSWRSVVSWLAVANGAQEKLLAASLISSMLLATGIALFKIRSYWIPKSEVS